MSHGTMSRAGRCVNTPQPLAHLVDRTDRQDVMDITCSVDGCERPTFRHNLCNGHYDRMRRTGSVGGPDFRVKLAGTGTCKADGCEKIIKGSGARGWCSTHYLRWQKYGDPNIGGPVKTPGTFIPCQAEGCDRRMRNHGYCGLHWERIQKNGAPHIVGITPLPPVALPGPASNHWKGDDVTYEAVHNRLHSLWGRAGDHLCVKCFNPARDWAYNHDDPDEKVSTQGWPYSTNLENYMPLCKSCHIWLDWSVR